MEGGREEGRWKEGKCQKREGNKQYIASSRRDGRKEGGKEDEVDYP